jgi:hypothetical protein
MEIADITSSFFLGLPIETPGKKTRKRPGHFGH